LEGLRSLQNAKKVSAKRDLALDEITRDYTWDAGA
jgi:hypothetical protein